jgi:hypothetical protein
MDETRHDQAKQVDTASSCLGAGVLGPEPSFMSPACTQFWQDGGR